MLNSFKVCQADLFFMAYLFSMWAQSAHKSSMITTSLLSVSQFNPKPHAFMVQGLVPQTDIASDAKG